MNESYPQAESRPKSYEMHGEEVTDEYLWLEDEKDPDVQEWVAQQNEFTDQWFERLDVDRLVEELKEDLDVHSVRTPWRRGDTYFWHEREPGQDHAILYRGAEPNATNKEVVIDPNELSDDGSVSLSAFRISKTGKFAVYRTQEGGTERDQVYIRDMETGEDEEFYFGRLFYMNWCDDEEGFYYTRSDYKSHGGKPTDEINYRQVYYHKLGEPREADELIFNTIDCLPKEAGAFAHDSDDGRYVLVNANLGWSEKRLFLIDKTDNTTQELLKDVDAMHGGRLLDGYIYLTTNHKANNRKVLRVPVENAGAPLDEWEVFIPEREDEKLEGWTVTKSEFIVEYTHNVTSRVERLDRKTGKQVADLTLPPLASLNELSTNKDFDEFFFSVSTFFELRTRYRYDPKTDEIEVFWKDPRSIDAEKSMAEQVWYTSKDGTEIPMFIVGPRKSERKSATPTLLTGYGGFSSGRYPSYLGPLKSWLKRGGVVAMPSLRGGDEFGERWHKAGMLEKKQNVFDDMIAAAEYLVDQDITSPNKLAISGGSNGGLLVGACITQRPDLFEAAVSRVPLLDMLRFNKFLMAQLWTHEYGSPDDPEAFEWLKTYSPYHNIEDRKDYPALLFITGTNDTRVHPMHAWKMAAKIQSLNNDKTVLLRTETKAGHGPGKGFYLQIENEAQQLAFMMHNLGVEI